MNTLLTHRDIVISADENTLVIENSKFSRRFDLSRGVLMTASLQYGGVEYAENNGSKADFSFVGMNYPETPEHPCKVVDISCCVEETTPLETEHVKVSVRMVDDFLKIIYTMEYFIYSDLAAVTCRGNIETEVMPNIYWSHRGRLSNEKGACSRSYESVTDSFFHARWMKPRYSVEFTGRTDYTDNVVIPHKIAGDGGYCGNIMVLADDAHKGVAYLQEAPPSAERRDWEQYDFLISDNRVCSCNWGIAPGEVCPSKQFTGYRSTLVFFDDEADFEYQLKSYLKKRFPANSDQAADVTVNPWGCGKFRQVVSQDFLLEEIRCASEVGASTYQIDDGWQGGGGLPELVVHNRKMDLDFWKVDKSFGGSLDKLIAQFEKCGIKPGLWVAPSFNVEFRDWREFADMLFAFYKKYNIRIFKIDGVKTRTFVSEENLRKMLTKLRLDSNGEIVFNLDTTNGQRPGYFLFVEFGNIFLENRYVCHRWGVGYHPERTLRNLWKLSRYMRNEILQIEVANPADVNPEFYMQKGETLPTVYDFEYWTAVTMFANPLIWMTPTTLSEENRKVLKKMMTLHRTEAKRIFSGTIFPIGKMPSGEEMTGFVSVSDEGGELIIYREKDEKSGVADIKLPKVFGDAQPEKLAGNGCCSIKDGYAHIEIPSAPGYLWGKWSK